MKHKFFVLLLSLFTTTTIVAQSGTCGANLTWILQDSVLTISGTGLMTDFPTISSIPWYSNRTSIKSVYINNGVTSISGSAFCSCYALTSVTIPSSVTSIGSFAFDYCRCLSSVVIPNSVTIIDNCAFRNCSDLISIIVAPGNPKYDSRNNCNAIIETATNTLIIGCQNTIIPTNVTSIGDYAFYGQSKMTSITIPSSVTSIGDGAFVECNSLPIIESIRYADTYLIGVVDKNLSTYNIRPETKFIGQNAFSLCRKLTALSIPNNVTSIGGGAFNSCGKLVSITIPSSVINIANTAFSNCSGLNSISVASGNPKYDSRNNCNAIIETATNTLIIGCNNTIIPNNVKHIGENAFHYYSNITSITIPSSVIDIASTAFFQCSNLGSINVESGNPKYDSRNNCNAIIETATNTLIIGCQNTIIPTNVTSIGDHAFYGQSKITSIIIPSSVTSIGEYAFSDCISLSSVTIPNSVKIIGGKAFWTCNNLSSVSIPNSVTSIGDRAFCFCFGLTSFIIPNSVTSIGDYVIANCTGLKSASFGDGIKTIKYGACCDCENLTNVQIGRNVTNIEEKAFSSCSKITSFTCYGNTPPIVEEGDNEYSLSNTTIVYVPSESLNIYRYSDFWSQYDVRPLSDSSIEYVNEELSSHPKKTYINNHLYILLPDGTLYSAAGQRVK